MSGGTIAPTMTRPFVFNISGDAYGASNVSLHLFNVKGELIADFKNVAAGKHIVWSPEKCAVSSGIFIARLTTDNEVLVTGKFIHY